MGKVFSLCRVIKCLKMLVRGLSVNPREDIRGTKRKSSEIVSNAREIGSINGERYRKHFKSILLRGRD